MITALIFAGGMIAGALALHAVLCVMCYVAGDWPHGDYHDLDEDF